MPAGHRTFLFLLLFLLTCSLTGLPATAAAPAGGDDSAITVVMDNNYPPFSFRDASGNLAGISVDLWRLWEQQTGRPVEITGLGWDEALTRMEAGEFDVIDTISVTPERAKTYDFTPPYANVDIVIFFNTDISGISGLGSLEGFVVGMNKGDSSVDEVKKRGIQVREYPDYEAVVRAAKDGEIMVFILDKPAGIRYLYNLGIQDRFRYTPPIISTTLHRAVKKGDTQLLDEINEGFAGIPKSDLEPYDPIWYGTPVVNTEYLPIAALVAATGFFLIVLLSVMNQALKRKVAQKTVELNAELDQRRRADEALNRATRKLGFLNAITFNDIQNAVFSLYGFLELEKELPADEKTQEYRRKQEEIIHTITAALSFAKNYQDLGMHPPAWQDVSRSFLFGVSHIDLSKLHRNLWLDNLEIYTDPLLERVFLTLAENVLLHGKTATEISLHYRRTPGGLVVVFEDNGAGIPAAMKEKIFERRSGDKKGVGLFLAREILSITGITLTETGKEGEGARFEMLVPEGEYRFPDES